MSRHFVAALKGRHRVGSEDLQTAISPWLLKRSRIFLQSADIFCLYMMSHGRNETSLRAAQTVYQ